jgi:hypothetical protein
LTALTTDQVRWIGVALLLASAASVGLAVPHFIKSRRAPYYALRREALGRATRWALVALLLLILAIILFIAAPSIASLGSIATPAPVVTPTHAPPLTSTPLPTRMPTAVPTRRSTATPPFIPTPTPDVPLPEAILTPLPSAVPAGEDAHIELQYVVFERGDQEVERATEFPPGEYRVYATFTYEGMKNGTVTTFAWYKDGELEDFCSDTWAWGLVEGRNWGERGRKSYYCKLPEGWQPGTYEIRVFIEARFQGSAQFVITE